MSRHTSRTCIVCGWPTPRLEGHLCASCRMSYDRANRRDSTTLGVIQWAANRARRFARLGRP